MGGKDPIETLKKSFKVEGLPKNARLRVTIRGKTLMWDHGKKQLVEA